MSVDYTLAEKQDYLRDNIIQKGYPAEEFVLFMRGLKNDGDNIDNWTIDELQLVVEKFIKGYNEKNGTQMKTIEEQDDPHANPPAASEDKADSDEQTEPIKKPTDSKITSEDPRNEEIKKENSAPPQEKAKVDDSKPLATYTEEKKTAITSDTPSIKKPEDKKPLEEEKRPLSTTIQAPNTAAPSAKSKEGKDNTASSTSLNPGIQKGKGLSPMFPSFPAEIGTKEFLINELTGKKASIKVGDPKIKEGGIFSSAVIHYIIETDPFKWKVARKYKECLWLREQLQKNFPYLFIPPLDKTLTKDKTDPKSVMTAITKLQRFFDELQRDKVLRSADITYYFLSLQERVQFDKKVKEFNKTPAPKSVADYKTIGGKAKVEVNPEASVLSQNISNYIPASTNYYDAFIKSAEETEKILALLSDASIRNSNLFKEFCLINTNVEAVEFADLFHSLQKLSSFLGELYRKQATLMRDKFGEVFRYYLNEANAMQDANALFDTEKKNYLRKEAALYAKKDAVFSTPNVAEWGLNPEILKRYSAKELAANKDLAYPYLLHKKTDELAESKKAYGFYANKIIEEAKRVREKNYRTLRKHFKAAADEYAAIFQDICNKWKEISEHIGVKITKLDLKDKIKVFQDVREELGLPSIISPPPKK